MHKSLISIEELDSQLHSDRVPQLIDVRSAGEFATGHVPGAINIPLEEVEARLDDLGDRPVAILCQSGRRAGMACELLQSHRSNLLIVEGGTQAWTDAGKPLVRTSVSRWSLERQVRLIAGLLVLTGSVLGFAVAKEWLFLSAFVGAGLSFAGLTNVCGMASLLALMPWNKTTLPKEINA